MAQSVKCLNLAQVMISQFMSLSSTSGFVLADSSKPGACFGFCVSLSVSAPPPFMLLSLSVSKINKHFKKINKSIHTTYKGPSIVRDALACVLSPHPSHLTRPSRDSSPPSAITSRLYSPELRRQIWPQETPGLLSEFFCGCR